MYNSSQWHLLCGAASSEHRVGEKVKNLPPIPMTKSQISATDENTGISLDL